MEAQYREIPIGELAASKLQVRTEFDQDKIEELAATLKSVGIIEPLVVRAADHGHNGRVIKGADFEIIAGERRWRAAKVAKLATVPCVIREMTDAQALEVMVIENTRRADLTALDEGDALRKYMSAAQLDVKAVASKIGKGEGYVYARLKLADLIDDAKALLRAGTMGPGHAILLARLTPEVQGRVLEACTEGEFWVDTTRDGLPGETGGPEKRFPTVRELEAILANDFYLDLEKAPFSKKDAGLVAAAGACVTCPPALVVESNEFGDNAVRVGDVIEVCGADETDAWLDRIGRHEAAHKSEPVGGDGSPKSARPETVPRHNEDAEREARIMFRLNDCVGEIHDGVSRLTALAGVIDMNRAQDEPARKKHTASNLTATVSSLKILRDDEARIAERLAQGSVLIRPKKKVGTAKRKK